MPQRAPAETMVSREDEGLDLSIAANMSGGRRRREGRRPQRRVRVRRRRAEDPEAPVPSMLTLPEVASV